LLSIPASLQAAPQAHRPARLKAAQELARQLGNAGTCKTDPDSGAVRRLQFVSLETMRGRPGQAARGFLEKHREAFGMLAGEGSVTETGLATSATGHHVRYRQTLRGLPVLDADILVDLDGEGRVRGFASDSLPDLQLTSGVCTVAATRAIRIARTHLSVQGSLRGDPGVSAVACPVSTGVARPAWRVTLPAERPLGDWEVLVDQCDGRVLKVRNLLRKATGSGRVFDPNAVVALQRTDLMDNNDGVPTLKNGGLTAEQINASIYKTVPLENLDGSGYLRGLYVNTYSRLITTSETPLGSITRALEPTLQFNYVRSNKFFEEVMAYYHLDRAQRFIQNTLGFNNVMNWQLSVNVHAFPDDNSYYSPNTKSLIFGEGGVDDAEDADVLLHEYGHAIQDDQVPGFGSTAQAQAMGEGFGDIFAVLLLSAHGQTFNVPVVADWDATGYSTANPPALRRVDGAKIYPQAWVGQEHRDGEIWSGALWAIRNQIGGADAGDRTLLRLILQSHFSLLPSASFADGANAILAADSALNGGVNIAAMRSVFVARGLLSSASGPVVAGISPRSELNDRTATAIINGFGFAGATAVSLSGPQSVSLSPFTVLSDSQLAVSIPAGLPTGSYLVNVTTPAGTGSGPARFRADDHPDAAALVRAVDRFPPGSITGGSISDGEDRDFFAFPAAGGNTYIIETNSGNDLDTVISVYLPDGLTELGSNDDISTSNHSSRLTTVVPRSGTYYVSVRGYDARVTGIYTVTANGPGGVDLRVESLTGPAAIVAGQPTSLSVDVRNSGNTSASGFRVALYATLSSAPDSELGFQLWSEIVQILPGNGSTALAASGVLFPETLVPGTYRLTAVADAAAAIAELDETNNTARLAGNLSVSSPRPVQTFTLSAPAGLSIVSLARQPLSATGAAYTAAGLASDLGSPFVAWLEEDAAGLPVFQSYVAGSNLPEPEPITGNRGYLVNLTQAAQVQLSGMTWPDGTERVKLLRGVNILAYPFGVPAGETPELLLQRTGAAYFGFVEDSAYPEERFKTLLPGSSKTGMTLQAGRGYLLVVPSPDPEPISLPRP
jgi:Zn-dependent metalloprotease